MKRQQPKADGLKQAHTSVKIAEFKLTLGAVAPHWGIREDILKRAKALVPSGLPSPYRQFLETQFGLIVETDRSFEEFQPAFKEVEDDILKSSGNATPQQREKVALFLNENAPLKLLAKLWLPLAELRYEYFTSSALKLLQRAKLFKKQTRIFEGSAILTGAFMFAMARDDLDFFARVGDVLRKRQQDFGSLVHEMSGTKLQKFLLKHWAQELDGVPPLSTLNISRLTAVCSARLGVRQLTEDSVEKTKQRLGLRSARSRARE